MSALEVTFAPWAQRGLAAVADGTVDANGVPRQHTTSVEAQLVRRAGPRAGGGLVPPARSRRRRPPRHRPDRAHRPGRRRSRERAEPVPDGRVHQRPSALAAHAGDDRRRSADAVAGAGGGRGRGGGDQRGDDRSPGRAHRARSTSCPTSTTPSPGPTCSSTTTSPMPPPRSTGRPELARSRLVCPRHLQAGDGVRRRRRARFRGGVLAGRGLQVDEATIADLAWDVDGPDTEVDLPIYHRWSFTTAPEPISFEALARRLRPVPAPPDRRKPRPRRRRARAAGCRVASSRRSCGTAACSSPRTATTAPGVGAELRSAASASSSTRRLAAEPVDGQYDHLVHDPVVTAPLYGGRPAGAVTVPPVRAASRCGSATSTWLRRRGPSPASAPKRSVWTRSR